MDYRERVNLDSTASPGMLIVMRQTVAALFFLACSFGVAAKAPQPSSDETLIVALGILAGLKPKSEKEFNDALAAYTAFEKTADYKTYFPPKEALAWVPSSGPCSAVEPMLALACIASFQRDQLVGKSKGSVHRSWLAVIKAYQRMRNTPGNDALEIAAIDEMIKKQSKGKLAAEAARIERDWTKVRSQ